jgi:hypothetical protein
MLQLLWRQALMLKLPPLACDCMSALTCLLAAFVAAAAGAGEVAGVLAACFCQAAAAAPDPAPPTRIPIIILLAGTRMWFPRLERRAQAGLKDTQRLALPDREGQKMLAFARPTGKDVVFGV